MFTYLDHMEKKKNTEEWITLKIARGNSCRKKGTYQLGFRVFICFSFKDNFYF